MDAYRACSIWSANSAASAGWCAGAGQAAGGAAQVGVAGQRAGEDRLGDAAHRHAQVERVLDGPAAGPLLFGLVEHDVDEGLAGAGVGVGQDLGGDLDEIGVQAAGVPGPEGLGDLRGRHADAVPEQVVRLGDELHVGVLDAVVHHLDEVAGPVRADVRAAGGAVHVRADRLEHRAEACVGLLASAGHDARAVQRALLAAGDAHADEVEVLLSELGLAAAGVTEVRVAAVDDHVAVFEQRGELVDHRVGGRAGVDHDDQPAGALERLHELLRGLGRDEVPLVAELVDHGRGAGGGPVVQGHGVSVPGEVAGQVPAHHAEAGHADLRRCLRHVLRVSSVLYSRCPVTATMPLGPPRGARESRRWRGRRYATGVSRWFGGCCGRSSMVELQPSKLVMRVRFPSPALFMPWSARFLGLPFDRLPVAGV